MHNIRIGYSSTFTILTPQKLRKCDQIYCLKKHFWNYHYILNLYIRNSCSWWNKWIHGFSYSKSLAKFEGFHRNISSNINLLFLRRVQYYVSNFFPYFPRHSSNSMNNNLYIAVLLSITDVLFCEDLTWKYY